MANEDQKDFNAMLNEDKGMPNSFWQNYHNKCHQRASGKTK